MSICIALLSQEFLGGKSIATRKAALVSQSNHILLQKNSAPDVN